jgi:hypothetical protein
MKNSFLRLLLLIAIIPLLLTSCIEQQVIFLSPYPNIQTSYNATPLLRDSMRVANYGSVGFTNGSSNDNLSDRLFIAHLKFHQSLLVGKNVQFFYGLQGSAGSYKVNWADYYSYPYYVDPVRLHALEGGRFTGSAGLLGGVSLVIPMGHRFEWKVIGVEGSVSKEFGDYQSFRENIPDSLVTMVDRKSLPGSVGGFTEFNFALKNKKSMGMKFGLGSGLTTLDSKVQYYNRINTMYYIMGYHFTIDRYTGYFQGRFGDYFAGFLCGVSYRF